MLTKKVNVSGSQRTRPSHTRKRSGPSPDTSMIVHSFSRTEKSTKKRPSESSKTKKNHVHNASVMVTSSNNDLKEHKRFRSVLKERIGKPADMSRLSRDLETFSSVNNNELLETSQLKKEVKKLQKTVKKQNDTLLKLCNNSTKEEHDLSSIVKSIFEPKPRDSLVSELQEKLQTMQENEAKLLAELKEQREAANSVVEKLNTLRDDTAREVEYFKQYYKDHYAKDLEKEINQCKQKVHEFDDEKEYLVRTVKELENVKAADKEQEEGVYRKIDLLRGEAEEKRKENEFLKEEIHNLKVYSREKEKRWDEEAQILKDTLDELDRENEVLKEREKHRKKHNSQENEVIKNRIKDLEEDIDRKEKRIVQFEVSHQNELEEMEMRINKMRNENRKLEEYEQAYQDLRRQEASKDERRRAKEKEYNDKLNLTKKIQDKRKREWSTVYNELLKEVWDLKSGMSVLEHGNQGSLSSAASRGFDHYA